MNDYNRLFTDLISAFTIAIFGWIFRYIRGLVRALRFTQQDLSTVWVHLKLKRSQRSGTYRYIRPGETEDEE